MQRVIVLKLGGSVLASEASLPRAVHEIYRFRRNGWAVVAVVSAFAGETDRLLAQARRLGASPAGTAAVAAGGEHRTAALLGACLDRAGVPAAVLSPAALALRASGPALAAAPLALDRARLTAALEREGVVVVPGFAGVDGAGRTVLFGRGGSDLTALFLAAELGARCRLVKDVDGLYEHDPARPGPRPRRYATATWADALATDGSILQHCAVRLARERRLAFEVARLGARSATLVGPGPTRFDEATDLGTRRRPLRVALLGLGTVGGGVWHLARALPDELDVVATCNRDARRADALGVPPALRVADPLAAARVDTDVVVECLGGREPALAALATALEQGRDVVTANKLVLAAHGAVLRGLARERGGRILAAAAVGGAAPVLERLAARPAVRGLPALPIVCGVRGVLNGTTNFVLEQLASGASLADALVSAQAAGLAERGPARGGVSDGGRDLDGRDAADKLRVIAAVLGHDRIRVARAPFTLDGLAARARQAAKRGRRLRQVAELELSGASGRAACAARVRLLELGPGDPLFALPGAENAAVLRRVDGALERVAGTGAGRWPTAEAVLGDLLELARRRRPHARARVVRGRRPYSSVSSSSEAELMQ